MIKSQSLVKHVLLAATLLCASVATAKTITVEHPMGSTTLETKPQRVVVLGMDSLDVLNSLNIEPIGVVKKPMPTYLEQYQADKYTSVGSLFEPDFETIYTLKPDLIIVSNRSSESMKELSKIAPTVLFMANSDDFWGSTQKAWRMMGQIFEKEAEIEAKITMISNRIAAINKAVTSKKYNALTVMSAGGKVTAFGASSRFGSIHTLFGFSEAVSDIKKASHGDVVSYEFIATAKPDFLFVLDRDTAIGRKGTAKSQFENKLIKNTQAYKDKRMTYLNPYAWYISASGIEATELMVDNMAQSLAL